MAYHIGDEIAPGTKLLEIKQGYVILLRNGQKEALKLPSMSTEKTKETVFNNKKYLSEKTRSLEQINPPKKEHQIHKTTTKKTEIESTLSYRLSALRTKTTQQNEKK